MCAEAKAGTAAGEARVKEEAGGGRKSISRGGSRLGESLGGRRNRAHWGWCDHFSLNLEAHRRSLPPPSGSSLLRSSFHGHAVQLTPTLDNTEACPRPPSSLLGQAYASHLITS